MKQKWMDGEKCSPLGVYTFVYVCVCAVLWEWTSGGFLFNKKVTFKNSEWKEREKNCSEWENFVLLLGGSSRKLEMFFFQKKTRLPCYLQTNFFLDGLFCDIFSETQPDRENRWNCWRWVLTTYTIFRRSKVRLESNRYIVRLDHLLWCSDIYRVWTFLVSRIRYVHFFW